MWRMRLMLVCACILSATSLLGAGCTDVAVEHPAVGVWGVRTQSDELHPVITVARDGAVVIEAVAGVPGGAYSGRWEALDGTTLRCIAHAGSEPMLLRVRDGELAVVRGGQETRGFVRVGR